MKKIFIITFLSLTLVTGCDLLEPESVNLIIDELVLNSPGDVGAVEIGLYNAFRGMASPKVIAGDFTADMIIHNGTFTQFREFGNKEITSANGAAGALWGSMYRTIYISNFILEKLPEIVGVSQIEKDNVLATAHFMRGYAYFVGAYTYGGIPLVINTSLEENSNIPRASKEDVLAQSLDDFNKAEELIPVLDTNPAFVSIWTVYAALARFHLYAENWQLAIDYATVVIDSEEFLLSQDFSDIVLDDFPTGSILEVGYTLNDDPGTSTYGLNNLFEARREVIPSNQAVLALNSDESGDRRFTMYFDPEEMGGIDNGWTVAKYGTADQDNNNIIIFRIAEMYLIRAEANVQLNNLEEAEDDINLLRERANSPTIELTNRNQALLLIEDERLYELAYEGHRWYDLVRTGRVDEVMNNFSANWRQAFERWPIPIGEIQNNPALQGDQNEGY